MQKEEKHEIVTRLMNAIRNIDRNETDFAMLNLKMALKMLDREMQVREADGR